MAGKPVKKRKKPKSVVIQKHHPVAENRTPFDEKFTIPLRMAQHRSMWRTIQTLRNTPETLRQIGNFLLAVSAEYLLRYRALRIKGEIPDDFNGFIETGGGGKNDEK